MNEDIIIKRLESGEFEVWMGEKHTSELTYEELVGTIAALCVTPNLTEMYRGWMKTDAEHEEYQNWLKKDKENFLG